MRNITAEQWAAYLTIPAAIATIVGVLIAVCQIQSASTAVKNELKRQHALQNFEGREILIDRFTQLSIAALPGGLEGAELIKAQFLAASFEETWFGIKELSETPALKGEDWRKLQSKLCPLLEDVSYFGGYLGGQDMGRIEIDCATLVGN